LKLIIFDGDCYLCDLFMRFIAIKDKKHIFTLSSQESPLGKKAMLDFDLRQDSVFYISNNKAFLYSEAVLEILKELPWPYKGLYVFKVIPLFLRDWIYKLIAKHRKKIFSKNENCQIIDINIKNKMK